MEVKKIPYKILLDTFSGSGKSSVRPDGKKRLFPVPKSGLPGFEARRGSAGGATGAKDPETFNQDPIKDK